MSLRIDLSGLDLDQLSRAADAAPAAVARAMEHIRGVAVAQTPVESGRLAGGASVHVEGDDASITYDGPYARYQHERLDLRHEHGNAKFLENAVRSERDQALAIIARAVREAI